ncbi:SHOCT domain-containing protein [Oceanobacillus damuensis]|uniref:SHOCT domain-containing protein n=1 Tax=Oceanobacillus damuensis TaxID=937928 RepID=UPI00082D767F|nr:SHOCT domain-containing protein [Oceanobacillus damuensis]
MPVELIVRLVLSLVILIVLIVILSKFRSRKRPADGRDSLTIMKERMEKGEITEEEYIEAKKRRGK